MPLGVVELSPIGLATAFAAGFISFVSPCVWPLVPAYLSTISGVAYADLAHATARVTRATAAFVGGFALVFTALGTAAGVLGSFLFDHRRGLEIAGGILMIAMGIAMLGFGQRLFGRELRFHGRTEPVGTAGAFVAGLAFAIGWSPCIGPTLGAILGLAATQGGAGDGAVLLLVYALGLGIPFLLAGLFFSSAMRTFGVLRRHQRALMVGAGAVMVGMGVLLASGQLTVISRELQRYGVPAI